MPFAPEEMPDAEPWLPQTFRREIAQKTEVAVSNVEIMACMVGTLSTEGTLIVLTEIAPLEYFV